MSYLETMILGLVQGVAEFLPISSSGHLTMFQYFFGMEEPDNLLNVLLHFATLVAVCVYYWRDVTGMVYEFFLSLRALFCRKYRTQPVPEARRLVWLVVLGTLPLFLVLPIKDHVERIGGSPAVVSCVLLVTGCILFISDRMAKGKKTAATARKRDVLLVGVAQGIATVPGLSRSGTTIAAGMALGFERSFAVRYSFLMSLPAVLGATVLEVKDVVEMGGVDAGLMPKYLLGMAVAGIVGYFSIRLVNLLAAKGKFGAFAYYCWGAGALFLILSLVL